MTEKLSEHAPPMPPGVLGTSNEASPPYERRPLEAPLYQLEVPYPPSVNVYYDHAMKTIKKGPLAGKKYVGERLSDEGLLFKGEVKYRVHKGHRAPPRLTGRLALRGVAFPPKLVRRRDLDNLGKALCDALTDAGVILDDVQFDEFSIVRGPIRADAGSLVFGIWRPDPDAVAALMDRLGCARPVDLLG